MVENFRENDAPAGLDPDEVVDLSELITRLEDERPVPAPAFRGELGRRIAASTIRARALPRLRRLAVSCAASGLALFAFVAVGTFGAGPLAS